MTSQVESEKGRKMNLFAEQKQTHRLGKTQGYQWGQMGGRDGLGVWD